MKVMKRTEIHDPEQRDPAELKPDSTHQCVLTEQIDDNAVSNVWVGLRMRIIKKNDKTHTGIMTRRPNAPRKMRKASVETTIM